MTSPSCANHDGVSGIALCVGCGAVLCAACTTRIRGRNLCVACMAGELGEAPRPNAGTGTVGIVVTVGAVLGLGLLVGVISAVGLLLHALG